MLDQDKAIMILNDKFMEMHSTIMALMEVVTKLAEGGVNHDQVLTKLVMPGAVPVPAEPVAKKPTVYQLFEEWYMLPEGASRTYGDLKVTMLVGAPLAPSNLDYPPCGLLKINHPALAVANPDTGERFAYVGLRNFWIELGVKWDFFDAIMNELTDDPDVGGTWRNAYTKPGGWYDAPFTQRRMWENSVTGLRDEWQTSADGHSYEVTCDLTKLTKQDR